MLARASPPAGPRMSRRALLIHGATSAVLTGLLGACGGSPASPAQPTGAQATGPPQTSGTRTTSTVVASPAATVAKVGKTEPAGRLVYGWHTAISPAWLDPQ